MYYPKKDYSFIKFRKSTKKDKKYDALLLNKKTNNIVIVRFGGIKSDGTPYEQYEDKTNLKLYKKYNHYDQDRRERYIKRHKNDINKPYSASYFSLNFLW
jgi:hypothetical protein